MDYCVENIDKLIQNVLTIDSNSDHFPFYSYLKMIYLAFDLLISENKEEVV